MSSLSGSVPCSSISRRVPGTDRGRLRGRKEKNLASALKTVVGKSKDPCPYVLLPETRLYPESPTISGTPSTPALFGQRNVNFPSSLPTPDPDSPPASLSVVETSSLSHFRRHRQPVYTLPSGGRVGGRNKEFRNPHYPRRALTFRHGSRDGSNPPSPAPADTTGSLSSTPPGAQPKQDVSPYTRTTE